MAAPWISTAEALARTGSFAALRLRLVSSRATARAKFFTHAESGSEYHLRNNSTIIRLEWWEPDWNPRHNGGSRFVFALFGFDLEAHGVEFNADELFPSALPEPGAHEPAAADLVAPEQHVDQALEPAKRKRMRGRVAYDVWQEIFDHLDKVVADQREGKKFATYTEAAQTGHDWLVGQQENRRRHKKSTAVPEVKTIADKISNLRPDLVRIIATNY
jgi:hypothetical protein